MEYIHEKKAQKGKKWNRVQNSFILAKKSISLSISFSQISVNGFSYANQKYVW